MRAALAGSEYVQGDKFYIYPTSDDRLQLKERWQGDHCVLTLLGKLYDTSQIFDTVADLSGCLNYTLKRNKLTLKNIVDYKIS